MDRKRYHMLLWRKLDQPGHEACALWFYDASWHLTGSAVFLNGRQPCLLHYHVVCDDAWRTESARVTGRLGARAIDIRLRADAARHWHFNGAPCPGVSGCIDADLNFSPSTNLISIRRLDLRVGEQAKVTAAWLRFPDFTVEPLEQTYHRVSNAIYRYKSGSYAAELRVNPDGFVTLYPGLWRIEGEASITGRRKCKEIMLQTKK